MFGYLRMYPYKIFKMFYAFRTGKRTRYGLLQDGYNSMIRYYKNNFTDGFRQVGIFATAFFLTEILDT